MNSLTIRHGRLFPLGIFLVVGASVVCAQETTATLVGSATDPSGAAVAGVLIRATNLATNISRDTQTDAAGNYSLPFLPAGDYSVTASTSGFQSQKVDQLTLQVQQTARMDFKLTVGSVTTAGAFHSR